MYLCVRPVVCTKQRLLMHAKENVRRNRTVNKFMYTFYTFQTVQTIKFCHEDLMEFNQNIRLAMKFT